MQWTYDEFKQLQKRLIDQEMNITVHRKSATDLLLVREDQEEKETLASYNLVTEELRPTH